ncbi:hypothetical protein Rahaq2_0149 [Rahnella aquatilis CIP 78.65 = ATCC 33071]|uniref:Uncharacterized protein n=1 Tax=Rahnella aquatilis (strain ATCC 33071 / DSM 4594 / JCM 1683 / NBRC 105701 / NCIMB 13365 / CIP 78.65) TaxID=745277 RepID=H2INW5_RAHAC|nr:hypothetical protein Rahaq2_0149 [Rahnella aquatilis CIP 78.65 = ATCC 33071]
MGSNENRGEERQISHTNVAEYSYYRDFVNNLTLSLRALKIV